MTGIIILAAGQSSRMGTPKQQLLFKDNSLLQHAVIISVASDAEIIIVVLGYQADVLRPSKPNTKENIVVNEHWQEGMAGSIRVGIKKLVKLQPQVENVIIMLCDQPLVTTELLNGLIQKKAATNLGIIACSYAGTVGVPALFGNCYFEYLAGIQGEGGAKKILRQFADDIATIDFPDGAIDIDTPEDFDKFLSSQNNEIKLW